MLNTSHADSFDPSLYLHVENNMSLEDSKVGTSGLEIFKVVSEGSMKCKIIRKECPPATIGVSVNAVNGKPKLREGF